MADGVRVIFHGRADRSQEVAGLMGAMDWHDLIGIIVDPQYTCFLRLRYLYYLLYGSSDAAPNGDRYTYLRSFVSQRSVYLY